MGTWRDVNSVDAPDIERNHAHRKLVGANIVSERKRLEYNQPDFADEVGVSQRHLSSWENGHLQPSLRYLEKIAALTGRTVGWFHDEHPEGDK